ncbi:MAG: hypothetical protein ABSC93_09480 [Bryobacteraceae bacterium]|jgi:hypothetical protein
MPTRNYLKVFAASMGADSVDDAYYGFDNPAPTVDEDEVQRLVQDASREMSRRAQEASSDE